uniref:MIP09489p n=1 Tax=Drosophila melanogaster TaxID=7227 RepID=C0PVA7_DROME|nr:MIP09489p [Drosophila melanogaster]
MAHIIGPKQTPNRQRIVFAARDVGVTSGNPFEVNTLDLMALSIKVSLEVTFNCATTTIITTIAVAAESQQLAQLAINQQQKKKEKEEQAKQCEL